MFRKCALILVVALAGKVAVSAQQPEKTVEAIRAMDRQWIVEAYFTKDLADFDRIVADDFLFTAGNGKSQSKDEKRKTVARDYTEPAVRSAPDYVFRIDPESHKVRIFGKTAISTGFVAEDYMWKTQHVKNRVYFTNVFLKRKGRWQVVASQFTNVKQP